MARWICAALILAMTGLGHARAASLEIYGELPTLSNVQISPDGSKLAYVTEVKGRRVIVVQTLSGPRSVEGVDLKNEKLRGLLWADSTRLLIITSREEEAMLGLVGPAHEWWVPQVYDTATRKQRPLLEATTDAMNVIEGAPQPRQVDGHTKVFLAGVHFENHQGERGLFVADLDSGHVTLLASGHNALGWIVDANGNVVAESDYDQSAQRWSLRLKRGHEWNDAYSLQTAIDMPIPMGISADGSSVVVTSIENGQPISKSMSLATGTWGPTLDHALQRPIEDPVTHRIIGNLRELAVRQYAFFDPDLQAAWDGIEKMFPHEDVTLQSLTNDHRLILIEVAGLPDGFAYYVIDRNSSAALHVGNAYDGLTANDLAPMKAIAYRATDGLEIPAYLTLPRNRDPKDLPLIVLPHGGPAARDEPGFDWWSQALASRGYAVLRPQFRGSAGISDNLQVQGYGQWGRKMQSDLSDGVRKLVADGIVDPKRVCIVGASYGGYTALAGVAFDPDVYRCAVSVAGVANLRDILRWTRTNTDSTNSQAMRFWDRYMGARDMDDPVLDELSPAKHVANINAPVLLIHGQDDTVVPINQSREMADAMKRAGKPVEFVTLKSEDHWLSRSETRLQMLEATVKFLEANNPPG